MPIELRELPSPMESNKDSWYKMSVALQPIIDSLPNEDDKEYFSGIMNLLIGKEPRISNIPEKLIFPMIDKGRDIADLYDYYRMGIWSIEHIRKCTVQYLNELATYLSREGDFMKYGFGGWTRQFQEQKIVTEETPVARKKKKILGLF